LQNNKIMMPQKSQNSINKNFSNKIPLVIADSKLLQNTVYSFNFKNQLLENQEILLG
jgi:hypothetical protein